MMVSILYQQRWRLCQLLQWWWFIDNLHWSHDNETPMIWIPQTAWQVDMKFVLRFMIDWLTLVSFVDQVEADVQVGKVMMLDNGRKVSFCNYTILMQSRQQLTFCVDFAGKSNSSQMSWTSLFKSTVFVKSHTSRKASLAVMIRLERWDTDCCEQNRPHKQRQNCIRTWRPMRKVQTEKDLFFLIERYWCRERYHVSICDDINLSEECNHSPCLVEDTGNRRKVAMDWKVEWFNVLIDVIYEKGQTQTLQVVAREATTYLSSPYLTVSVIHVLSDDLRDSLFKSL